MASRELARLKRLRLDRMDQRRLRQEIEKTIVNLTEEAQAIEQMQAEHRQLATALRATQKRERALQGSNAKLVEELQLREEKLAELSAALDAARKETVTEVSSEMLAKIAELEVRNTQLSARLNASNRLLEQLQAAQDTKRDAQPAIKTAELFSKFTTEIESAAEQIKGEFVVDDIEVDVRGAMGLDGGDVVMGLDHKRVINDESATRIRFALRRKASVTKLE